MATLEFLSDAYPIILTLTGILGFFMGFDRIVEEEEEENKVLQILGVIGGILVIIVIILAVINNTEISKYTIFFSILFGVSLLAKPLRKVKIAFAVSALVGLGLTFFVLYERRKGNETFFGTIALKWLVLAIFFIVLIVFIVSFIQEQTMDIMLFLLHWGATVFTLSFIMFLQGVTLLFNIPDNDGLLGLLPG